MAKYDNNGNLIYKGWKIVKETNFEVIATKKGEESFSARSYAEAKAKINNEKFYIGLKGMKEVQ